MFTSDPMPRMLFGTLNEYVKIYDEYNLSNLFPKYLKVSFSVLFYYHSFSLLVFSMNALILSIKIYFPTVMLYQFIFHFAVRAENILPA